MQIARANAQATIPLQTALPYRRAWSLEPSLPVPISNRLDLLVELAEQAGARTSRTAIVAARSLGAAEPLTSSRRFAPAASGNARLPPAC